MSGQQQIGELNQENYYNQFSKELLRQADLFYLEDKFAIETKYNEDKFLHAMLYKEMLCTDNCEIIKFINKKLRGALEGKLKIVSLKALTTEYADINNYYINQGLEWNKGDEPEW